MSPNMNINSRIKRLWQKMKSPDYRHGFVASHLSSTIAAQIQAMRESRGWTQKQLAEATGMKQSRISVLEDPNNQSLSIATLRRIAVTFDVALDLRFVSFGKFLRWSATPSDGKFSVKSFSEDTIIFCENKFEPAWLDAKSTDLVFRGSHAHASDPRFIAPKATANRNAVYVN